MLYELGKERILFHDRRGNFTTEPDDEFLLLRLGADAEFASWYVVGSPEWPEMRWRPGKSPVQPNKNASGDETGGGQRIECGPIHSVLIVGPGRPRI